MRSKIKIFTVLCALVMIAWLAMLPGLAEEAVTTPDISVSVGIVGTPPASPEDYVLRLTAQGDIPMPEGKIGGTYDLTVSGAGSAVFPQISYDNVGVYAYTIAQVPGSSPDALNYDDTEYDLKVTVHREDGKLVATCALREKSIEGKIGVLSCPFTNEYAVATVSQTIAKVWDDAENQDGVRPASLIAVLSANGTAINQATLNNANNWTATIDGLPQFEENTRTPIAYTWTEPTIVGYTQADAAVQGNATTLTNTHVPETIDLTVIKAWNDGNNAAGLRPNGVTARLMNGDTQVATVVLQAANNWRATVTGLPRYAGGQEINYTWAENAVAGYALTGNAANGTTTTLTNTPTAPTYTLTVRYIYVGGRQAAPTVTQIHVEGDNYNIVSPAIRGYTANVLRVRGTMPDHDVEYLVIYVPGTGLTTIDDFETPLGLGNVVINIGDCYE